MGATSALYSWGFEYQNPNQAYDMDGYVNSPAAVEALEFYKGSHDDSENIVL